MKLTEGALVLEGGSLRSMFTNGVIDVLLEKDIHFSYVNGVSAGTMVGMNYLSGQIGRNYKINMEYVHDKRYLSYRNMFTKRMLFGFDFIFGELSNELIPFDKEAFEASPQRFVATATRCRTGKPVYFEKGNPSYDILTASIASSSLPIVSRMVCINGKNYLDGGLSMPIPYQRAIDEGYRKVVLVLTREKGYRKKPTSKLKARMYQKYLEPLPELLESVLEIPERYNRMQGEIDALEGAGRIFVIRPPMPVKVSRTEKDKKKLDALYRTGRSTMEEDLPRLLAYLESE